MEQKRNYGIDLLRIVAMVMIIVLHILGAGGIIYTLEPLTPMYVTAWFLEFAAYCAVNCYALISGYVGIYSKFKISNILQLWLQVAVTTLAITLGFYFIGADVTGQDILNSCMPIKNQFYWYFTAYVCLYLLTPALNWFLLNTTKKMARYLLWVFVILFSVVPTLFETDLFGINSGYSALWLVVLYLSGGFIRKFQSEINIKKRVLFGGYAAAVILTLLSKIGIEYLTPRVSFEIFGSNFLMNYHSPTMVVAGVCLLVLFARLDVRKLAKPIAFLAPVTFGVYIIHSHPLIWNKYIVNGFIKFTELKSVVLVVAVFLTAMAIFVICSIVEFVRGWIFKVLHVFDFCRFVDEKIRRVFGG